MSVPEFIEGHRFVKSRVIMRHITSLPTKRGRPPERAPTLSFLPAYIRLILSNSLSTLSILSTMSFT